MNKKDITICKIGYILLFIYYIASIISSLFLLTGYMGTYEPLGNFISNFTFWLLITFFITLVNSITYLIGITLVYLKSVQLGITWRIVSLILGLFPLINIPVLQRTLIILYNEHKFEYNKYLLNKKREKDMICKTKYPILLVHGVFFRDSINFNYWGRIPNELIRNGASIYYGNHNSASSVESAGKELAKRIKEIINETGAEKINVIAHSKGGLDIRSAICNEGVGDLIASLTTINTPHRGCMFADYILDEMKDSTEEKIARIYNAAAQS